MSRVKEFITKKIEFVQREQSMPATWKDRRVTVRLSAVQYGALLLLVRRISGSVTSCAEALLSEALCDALEAIGYISYDDATTDIMDALKAENAHEVHSSISLMPQPEKNKVILAQSGIIISHNSENAESSDSIHTREGGGKMNEVELYSLLGKIGKRVFVEHFMDFGDPNISNQEMIARLPMEYTFNSRTSRTSKSRRIFREGLEQQALSLIAMSNRVEPEVAIQARALLVQISKSP